MTDFAPSLEQLNRWKRFQAAFDPWQARRPGQIEGLYVERPNGPLAQLSRQFAVLEDHNYTRVVLCGARGSGKTTELARLHSVMREQFAVFSFDLEGALPPGTGTLGLIAVLGALAAAGTADWHDPAGDGSVAVATSSRGRFQEAFAKVGIGTAALDEFVKVIAPLLDLVQGSGGVPDGTVETVQILASGTRGLSQVIGRLLDGRDPSVFEAGGHARHRPEADALIATTNERLAALRQAAGKPALFILDGLDRTIELSDVQALFRDVELLRAIESNLVLSGPLAVRHTAKFRAVGQELYAIPLENVAIRRRTSPAEADPAGLDLLRAIYTRRCEVWDLEPELVDDGALNAAACMSAGLVRDFLRLLRDASLAAAFSPEQRVTAEFMDAAIGSKRRELQGYLRENLIDVLHHVLETTGLPEGDAADQLLFENFIACYANGDVWFRPHELLVAWLERLREEQAERQRAADTARGQ